MQISIKLCMNKCHEKDWGFPVDIVPDINFSSVCVVYVADNLAPVRPASLLPGSFPCFTWLHNRKAAHLSSSSFPLRFSFSTYKVLTMQLLHTWLTCSTLSEHPVVFAPLDLHLLTAPSPVSTPGKQERVCRQWQSAPTFWISASCYDTITIFHNLQLAHTQQWFLFLF